MPAEDVNRFGCRLHRLYFTKFWGAIKGISRSCFVWWCCVATGWSQAAPPPNRMRCRSEWRQERGGGHQLEAWQVERKAELRPELVEIRIMDLHYGKLHLPIFGDRLVADFVSQLAPSANDPPISPTAILPGKREPPILDCSDRWCAPHRRSDLGSVKLHSSEFAVPTKNGFRSNDLCHLPQGLPAKTLLTARVPVSRSRGRPCRL